MTGSDVISVEHARLLKRLGLPQVSEAYWHCVIPSLNTIQGMPIEKEDKGRLQWRLYIGQPEEPSVAAFTSIELQTYLKGYLQVNNRTEAFPTVKKSEKNTSFICSIAGKELFIEPTEQDAFAKAVIYFIKK